ncbi:hypothetical protein SAY87_014949 [Trapa incisa]|uniref:STICHEL DnaA-N-like alpha-beta domain-containing protein n=1 Tax=Trapa incisa TaxID=236973 RepID=A0AAN7GPB2_9MYRT|nr:hypothetical protein SAY87_014949 [Trapa incisa]
MAEPVRSGILKDVNGDINGHLRDHIHFTNYIHLKNRMQRSHSLWDPSASTISGHPQSVDVLPQKCEKQGSNNIQDGRRSIGTGRSRQWRRFPGNSPQFSPLGSSHITSKEESSHCIVSGKSDSIWRKKRQKGKQVHGPQFKTIVNQLNDVRLDIDDHPNIHPKRALLRSDGKAQESGSCKCTCLANEGKRPKFRTSWRPQAWVASQHVGVRNMSLSGSSSHGQRLIHMSHLMEEEVLVHEKDNEEEEEEEHQEKNNSSRTSRDGCGIPWDLSKNHQRGRSTLDYAGCLSSGHSETRRVGVDLPVTPDNMYGSSKSKIDASPHLDGYLGCCKRIHDYSEEFRNFADYFLKNDLESDHSCAAKSNDLIRCTIQRNFQHNLIQKYEPRRFRDLVGQNLVVKALSNAVMWQKIGQLYVFYGQHGTGKTSCARIFSRALNCQSCEEPKPCGFCSSCNGHYPGKNQNVIEVEPISSFHCESISKFLNKMAVSISSCSQYKVVIFDDCDALSRDCWGAILKLIEWAPRKVVFILVCSTLKVLPHTIISSCQKFFFPKLKDADIMSTLQWVSSKEHLDVEEDAMKLIAWRSSGSLREALMTLDQLSLLGERISLTLVQELIGLISDEKLVDLLDSALSTDTVNTVKNLRVLLETGVEPLALMSQLAMVVTNIISGAYDLTTERNRRKFFQCVPLSKEEMERLHQALKTLLEAETMLRLDNDKMTLLAATLLQLTPNKQSNSSVDYRFSRSPLDASNLADLKSKRQGSPEHVVMSENGRGWLLSDCNRSAHTGSPSGGHGNKPRMKHMLNPIGSDTAEASFSATENMSIHDIWSRVIDKVHIAGVKEFMLQEGRLLSVNFAVAPDVQLLFSSQQAKAKAEKFQEHIMQAFQTVLGSSVTLKISSNSKDIRMGALAPLLSVRKDGFLQQGWNKLDALDPPRANGADKIAPGEESSHTKVSSSDVKRRNVNKSIVKRKASLADVIQWVGGRNFLCSSGSTGKTFSMAKILMENNLRDEPKLRSQLGCFKEASRTTRSKLFPLKIRARRKHGSLLKLVSCRNCFGGKSQDHRS